MAGPQIEVMFEEEEDRKVEVQTMSASAPTQPEEASHVKTEEAA